MQLRLDGEEIARAELASANIRTAAAQASSRRITEPGLMSTRNGIVAHYVSFQFEFIKTMF